MIRTACIAATCLLASPAGAHPHVFIDTGLTLVFDAENRLAAIRVTWSYDELYSLLILEERGLDSDYDGELTAEELDALRGFDLNWAEDFEGDIYLTAPEPVALARPTEPQIAVVEGRIVATHLRPLAAPLPVTGPVSVKSYDPTYYTAYEIRLGVEIEGGAGCTAALEPADLDAAYTLLEELLYATPSAEFSEDSFPEVGEAFSDEVVLTCAGRS